MSEYIPNDDEVRDAYDYQYLLGISDESRIAEFDSWLTSVKAEAWAEGWLIGATDVQFDDGLQPTLNPYVVESTYSGVDIVRRLKTHNPYREETSVRKHLIDVSDEEELVEGVHSHHCDDFGCGGCVCEPECDDREETE